MSEAHALRCRACDRLHATMADLVTHALLTHADHVEYLIAWCYLDAATFAWWSAATTYGDPVLPHETR